MSDKFEYGTGRRKTATARTRIYAGAGNITVNGRSYEEYFPRKTLQMVVRQPLVLTKMAENDIPIPRATDDVTSFLAAAAVDAGDKLHTKAIITDSYSGKTARYLAAYRGTNPILALCYHERTTRELALSYGVFPMYQCERPNTQEYFLHGLQVLMRCGLLAETDSVCYLSGSFGAGFGTTFLEVNRVDKIFQSRDKYLLPNF